MQDDISEKSMNLCAQVGKTTADELKRAIDKLIAELTAKGQGKQSSIQHGKQTLEQLDRHGSGRSSIELTDPNLRLLKREMDKKSVDLSVQKDGKGKYLLFFKANDADVMTQAFKSYSRKMVKQTNRPSITKSLAAMKQKSKDLDANRDKVKKQSKGERPL